MLPVDKNKDDPFYRYKMPEAVVTHETSKTVIQNLDQIAKAISRNPIHILKFLSISFGCTCATGNKYMLNGNFDADRIQGGIYDFIETFVLCKKCRNPETRFTGGAVLKRTCNSCGEEFVQENHKLNTMIAKDRSINEDNKYEVSNKNNIHILLKEDIENSDRIYEVYKQEEVSLEQIFGEYVKAKDLKRLRRVLKEFEVSKILGCIEIMLENNKKVTKIESYLNELLEIGFTKEEIIRTIEEVKTGRKRDNYIKKVYEGFCEEE